jgi:serine/threonine-protein kinase
MERFMREIKLHASLNHPNIAALHNAFRFDNQLIMVIEFVDGETLADLLRRGPLPPRRAVEWIVQMLTALDYAHARGVIHRDIKPSNIMLTREGMVKLMDFGIARAVGGFGQLTQTGAAVGSMYYMSPEQIRGETIDGRSDVYAAGVTLFEALTGQLPVGGKTANEVLEGHMHRRPPMANTVSSEVSEALSNAIAHALEKDPSRRYQTAGEFARELLYLAPAIPNLTVMTAVQTPKSPDLPSWAAQTPRTASQPFQFDPVGLERVRKDLARHIGPMAKVLVERAAKKSRNWQDLYSLLSTEVPAGKDRERFMAACPRT